jgi:ribosomal protein S18 acetylase RimI-like enzyme
MEIRTASVEDVPVIHKLAHAIWPVAYKDILTSAQLKYMLDLIYAPHQLIRQIEKLGHRFIVIDDDYYGSIAPVGFASWSLKSPSDPTIFKLHKLYVLPAKKGKGCGKFMLDHIMAIIKKQGASVLELNVNRNNDAQLFYHKMGFSIKGEEDIDIGKGYFMNDYVMERKVHGP